MKKLHMYYVYDKVGETVITGPIPAANDLVALIGFRDAYIKNPSQKMPYSYQALELVKFATFDVDENGCLSISKKFEDYEVKVYSGNEVIQTISEECKDLGIDDQLVEEQKEE